MRIDVLDKVLSGSDTRDVVWRFSEYCYDCYHHGRAADCGGCKARFRDRLAEIRKGERTWEKEDASSVSQRASRSS